MELDEFIEKTLLSIVNGVTKAQAKMDDVTGSAIIAPSSNVGAKQHMRIEGRDRPIHDVSYDIVLTLEEGTQTKGGIGVAFGMIALGSTGQSDVSQTAANRIQFTVPIILPES